MSIFSFVMLLSTDGRIVNWYKCSQGKHWTVNQYSSYGHFKGLPQSSCGKKKGGQVLSGGDKRDVTEMVITMSIKEL